MFDVVLACHDHDFSFSVIELKFVDFHPVLYIGETQFHIGYLSCRYIGFLEGEAIV